MISLNRKLHLAIKLSKIIKTDDINAFLLGTAYPFKFDDPDKKEAELSEAFKMKSISSFDFGVLFSLWAEKSSCIVQESDLSKYDCMICDMEEIIPKFEELKAKQFEGREKLSYENIMSLEKKPVPLYLVNDEKKAKYNKILDSFVSDFKNYISGI